MKNAILAGAAALLLIGAAAPGVAQYGSARPGQGWNNDGAGWNRDAFWRDAPGEAYGRIDFLQRRIDRGVADGSLDRRETRQAQVELNDIRRMAAQFRGRDRGRLSPAHADMIQSRLDTLGQRLRWQRRNGGGGYGWQNAGPGTAQGYGRGAVGSQAGGDWDRRYATDYDATRHYREGPQYSERRLTAADEVYRGSDGRYYCKRNDGTTGLIAGGVGGGVLGNLIDGGHNRVAGTLIGGALGALAGKAIEQGNSDVRCR